MMAQEHHGFHPFGQVEAENHHQLDDLLHWRYEVAEATPSIINHPLGVEPNPLVVGDAVFASTWSPGKIIALERESGKEVWTMDLPRFGSSHVTFADGVLYGRTAHTLFAIDPERGEVKWRWTPYEEEGEWMYSSPVISEDRLIIGDNNGVLHCLNTDTSKEHWWAQPSDVTNNAIVSTALIVGDVVVAACNAAIAIGYDLKTGREMWRQPLDRGSISQIQRLGEFSVITSWNSIYLLDPQTGEIVHRWCWDDRRIRCLTVAGEGRLLAITEQNYGPDEPPPDAPEAELRGLDADGAVSFETTYRGLSAMVRYDPVTALVYEGRADGLGIIAPETGKRLHHIGSDDGLFKPTLPYVVDGTVYMLADEVRFGEPRDHNGRPRRVGVILAIRHP